MARGRSRLITEQAWQSRRATDQSGPASTAFGSPIRAALLVGGVQPAGIDEPRLAHLRGRWPPPLGDRHSRAAGSRTYVSSPFDRLIEDSATGWLRSAT